MKHLQPRIGSWKDWFTMLILEFWRPDPSELTLLLTKGVDSALLKVPPTAITLTGSSDPCYVEAYHLTDSSDGRITPHLKVLNLTELELNRVDIRVGLSGALYYRMALLKQCGSCVILYHRTQNYAV